MSVRKQSALLLMLICILAACSEHDDLPLLNTEVLKEPVEEVIPKELEPSTFRLAAWNIRIFSDGSRNDDELHHIAKVLIRYDFITIVELRDEGGFDPY